MPPMHILNAPTKLMKNIGYGKGYAYDHDADEAFSGQDYWPEEMDAADLLRADRPRLRSTRQGTAGLLGTSGANSCNKAPTSRVELTGTGGSEQPCTIPGAYWQAQLMYWGPKVLIAILILIATWIVARAVKWVLQKAIDRTPALKKHMTGTPDETVGHQLGTIAKLIIWLVGIMAALQFLGVGQILAPINELVTEIFAFLPRLIGAGLFFFVGLVLARHRQATDRDSAHRGQRRRPARPRWHRLDRRNNAHAAGSRASGRSAGRHPRQRRAGRGNVASTHSSSSRSQSPRSRSSGSTRSPARRPRCSTRS